MPGSGQGPARFAVWHAGTCSFCGKRDREVDALAGVAERAYRICNECLGLCLDILTEFGQRTSHELSAEREANSASDPGRPETEYERLMRAQEAGDVDYMVEVLRQHGHPDVDSEVVREVMEVFRRRAADSQGAARAERPRPDPPTACSFCDAARAEVKKLIDGPGVSICDRCVGEALTAVRTNGAASNR